jgi:hypothetical protein
MIQKSFAIILMFCMVTVFSSTSIANSTMKLSDYMALTAIDTLPEPWYMPGENPETIEQRETRLTMISEVIAEQAPIAKKQFGWFWSSDDLALAAFTKTWYESGRFKLNVHSGKARGDHGKSVCLGQIMNGKKDLIGVDRQSTSRCINEVMKHLSMHQKRCLNEKTPASQFAMAKVFAGYGTGYSCDASAWMPIKDSSGQKVTDQNGNIVKDHWAAQRARTWWKLRSQLQ